MLNKLLGTIGKLPANPCIAERLCLLSIAAILLLLIPPASSRGMEVSTEGTVQAESSEATDAAIHDELREFRVRTEALVAEGNWDGLRPLLSSQVVVVWLDGTQCHGIEEVVEYLKSKTEGENAIVDRFKVTTEVAALSDLYGKETAVAFGSATSDFLLRGSEISMEGPWAGTMVKEDGKWKLASLTASIGAFDNPLLIWLTRTLWVVGIVAGLAGIAIGWLVGRRTKRIASSH
ncbi:MAG: hypothetical protein P8L85_14780 [Rubripirellula sp.]|nr:hypothetical protein [Rubripirellula sp.]